MTITFLLAWFAVMFPLVFSPGPANIAFAASGASFGIKRSLPLMFGIESVFFIKSLFLGFGLSAFLQNNQVFISYFQVIGALYLIYLAYGFIKPLLNNENHQSKELSYFDGLIIQFFNVKGWMMIVLMFSLFSSSLTYENSSVNILILCIMLAALNLTCHLIWISFSSLMFKKIVKNQKVQAYLFASSLLLVAISFILDSNVFIGF
ncbi:MAG: LysE family translocator [Campylobacteraceae bacterium]|nr:LysE family translocator [Campylobacteraceae bacterium]